MSTEPRVIVSLPAESRAARIARSTLEPRLTALPDTRRPDARLLATELVTNAFRHGAPPITMTVEINDEHLRVEVGDSGGGRPRRRPDPGPDGGWGLVLVDAVADRWGVADGSTSVWFEIDR